VIKKIARLAGRYGLPCFARAAYYSLRYRCLVSLRADVQLSRNITIGRGSDIRPYARIVTTDGPIRLGRGVGLNSFVFISTGSGFVDIGDDVRIGPHTTIIASNRGFDDPAARIVDQPKSEQGITIGDGVWIGANAVILDGVTIGQGAVIGGGAVVTRDIPAMAIAVGNPARVIRMRGERRPAVTLEAIEPAAV
jgi:acetyltransferase-like isoleucine patch superfamily enzyme